MDLISWLFFIPLLIPYGDFLYTILGSILFYSRGMPGDTVDPPDPEFIQKVDFMFPENFLSRFPEEADSYRLKIYVYLIFNILVKGHGSRDPGKVWDDYNRADFNRALVDAVFYEYLTNFTDKGFKDLVFDPFEDNGINISKPVSSEEIAVNRIGEYLDLLTENKPRPELMKGAYDILSETPTMSRLQGADCDMRTLILTSGIPGKDYPNFCDIPKTSFSCAGKLHVPGVYADYETGCQVFHVCWPGRKDSFLCPIGTIFNQSHWTCDIWHDTSCHLSIFWNYFGVNSCSLVLPEYNGSCESLLHIVLKHGMKILPDKCKVQDVPGKKIKTRDIFQLKMKLEVAVNKIKESLQMFTKMMSDLDKRNGDTIVKRLEPIPKSRNETVKAIEFLKKLGETNFKPPQNTEEISHRGKVSSGRNPGPCVTRSALLMPSKSLGEQMKLSRNRHVPGIVMKSLRLGGTILNEGIFPLAKQVMIDSYRKIESKVH